MGCLFAISPLKGPLVVDGNSTMWQTSRKGNDGEVRKSLLSEYRKWSITFVERVIEEWSPICFKREDFLGFSKETR